MTGHKTNFKLRQFVAVNEIMARMDKLTVDLEGMALVRMLQSVNPTGKSAKEGPSLRFGRSLEYTCIVLIGDTALK